MDFSGYSNTYYNVKSLTMQPRGETLPIAKHYMLQKYFKSQLPNASSEPANYANVPNGDRTCPRSHHRPNPHYKYTTIDSLTVLHVCNELGNLDSPPPMPPPRTYTITHSRNHGLYKVQFPHNRLISMDFTDISTGTKLRRGTSVVVLGPSKNDRSKFSVCQNIDHIDIPHQYTVPFQLE